MEKKKSYTTPHTEPVRVCPEALLQAGPGIVPSRGTVNQGDEDAKKHLFFEDDADADALWPTARNIWGD